jgi:GT2 family glycosyltransferase
VTAVGSADHRFHLVISTIRSPDHLERCLAAVRRADVSVFVTVVEQRPEAEALPVLQDLIAAGHAEHLHEPVERGLSRGRNAGLRALRGEVIAFPDDDCWYDDGVLETVSHRLDSQRLDGATIPCRAADDRGTMLRWRRRPGRVTRWRVPRTVISSGIFLRREVLERTGLFDVELGTGAGTPFGAGEENDLVLRTLRCGAVIGYMPDLTVRHPDFRDGGMTADTLDKIRRYNRGFGRVLRKNRLPLQAAYWIGRAALGSAVSTVRRDHDGTRFQRTQLVSRWQGWRGIDDEGWRHPL